MNRQRPPPRPHPWVPKTHAVQPGAAVTIVQKADQPTGRTVSGTVADVLTRGNHPRGIKVRLADGRVGRVQGLAGGGSSAGDPGGVAEGLGVLSLGAGEGAGAGFGGSGGDGDGEGGEGLPLQQVGLEAYIKQAKPKRKGKGKGKAGGAAGGAAASTSASAATATPVEEQDPTPIPSPPPPAEMATCPVCGEFEGDEAAVSHHVAGHFDSTS